MKWNIGITFGSLLLLCPWLAGAQTITPTVIMMPAYTASANPSSAIASTPTDSSANGELTIVSPIPTAANSSSSELAQPNLGAQPEVSPQATLTDEEAAEKQIKDTEDEIAELNSKRSDKDLEFRHLTQVYLEDLLKEKAAAAKRAKNLKKYNEIIHEIAVWEKLRTDVWDDDQALIDKRAAVRKMQRDHVRLLSHRVEEKLKAGGLFKRVEEVEAGLSLLDQVQSLDDQEVALEKQLTIARENYDFKAVGKIREKLKETHAKYGELGNKAAQKLKEFHGEDPAEMEQQNL